MTERCPECKSSNLSYDSDLGELVCNDCGLVVEEQMIDFKSEFERSTILVNQERRLTSEATKVEEKELKKKLRPTSFVQFDKREQEEKNLKGLIGKHLRYLDMYSQRKEEEYFKRFIQLRKEGLTNGVDRDKIILEMISLENYNRRVNYDYRELDKEIFQKIEEGIFMGEFLSNNPGIIPDINVRTLNFVNKSEDIIDKLQQKISNITEEGNYVEREMKIAKQYPLTECKIKKDGLPVINNRLESYYKIGLLKKPSSDNLLKFFAGPNGFFETIDSKYRAIAIEKDKFIEFIEKDRGIQFNNEQREEIRKIIDYAQKYTIALFLINLLVKDKDHQIEVNPKKGLICACVRFLLNNYLPKRNSKDPAISISNILDFLKQESQSINPKILCIFGKRRAELSARHKRIGRGDFNETVQLVESYPQIDYEDVDFLYNFLNLTKIPETQ